MKKEIIVTKDTDADMNPHWETEIILEKGMESAMEQTNNITIVEAPKELDSIGAFGFTAKSQNMSYAVIGLLVVVAGYLLFKRLLK